MEDRSQLIRSIRPMLTLQHDITRASTQETYQNEVLRPILKFQNNLILHTFQDYCERMKITPSESVVTNLELIKNILARQQKMRSQYLGMIVGLMSLEEYEYYLKNQKVVNKRIISMLVERIISQL